MHAHFSSFTPEGLRAFGQELAAEAHRRAEFLADTRRHTSTLLADFRRDHRAAETQRRQRAAREADGRRLFMSELRSGVHALRSRFELGRRETVADLRQMAGELRAASEAFRGRPGRGGATPWQRGGEAHDGSRSRPAAEERPGHAKRRHG